MRTSAAIDVARAPHSTSRVGARRALAPLALLVALPGLLRAQQASALRKSDLVRFLTGTTYNKTEIAHIIQRSCLAFVPSARDRQDLRELGATSAIFREIDDCVRHDNKPVAVRTPAPPPRPLDIVPVTPTVSATAGTVAGITVQARRGRVPVRGAQLLLHSAGTIPGASQDVSAVTNARGRATFSVPAGIRAGTYQLTISSAEGTELRGGTTLQLVTTPAAATSATLDPATLAIGSAETGTRPVVVTVADPYGNPVPDRVVQLRAPRRTGLDPMARRTGPDGTARFTVSIAPLRDRDSIAVVVDGKRLAALPVTTASAAAAANVAAGRTAGLMLEAARLASIGQHARAEAVYDSVLAVDPNILAARLGRAYVRSWQREDSLAQRDFLDVLRADSLNVSALTGLGYNYAWSGDWDHAEARFRDALHVAPMSIDAAKGLAYVSLWRGNAREAQRRFRSVVEQFPHDAEAQVGLGQASLKAGDDAGARAAFERALQLDPGRTDARQGLAVARGGRTRSVELSLWGGYTSFSNLPSTPLETGNGTSEFGVRFAEVAYWPTPKVRVWAQYDNGLTLDNFAYVRAGETAPSYYFGGFVNYGDAGRYTTRLEGGFRHLPSGVHQTLLRGEQVIDIPSSVTVKFGGWLGPRSDNHTEWLGYGAVGVHLGPRFRLEPTFFYARSGVPGESEKRLLLYGEYAFPNGWKVGTGIAGGRATLAATPSILPNDPLLAGQETQKLWDAYLITEAPFGAHRAHLLLRHQQIVHGTGLTVVALGVTLGF